MPNWCSTNISIKSSDTEKLNTLYNNLHQWSTTDHIENGFGKTWLGNIISQSGLAKFNEESKNFEPRFACRGSLDYLNMLDKNTIVIDTYTAWEPMLEMWVALAEKFFPDGDYELLYTAEEPGCEVYLTNDPEVAEKFSIETYPPDDPVIALKIERAFPESNLIDKDSVTDGLQDLLEISSCDMKDLLKELQNSPFSDYLFVHEFDFEEIEAFC